MDDLTSGYPPTWNSFIGQDLAKNLLQVAIASAKRRRAPLEHVLLAHRDPGIGKTALATLITRTMGVRSMTVSGKMTVLDARIVLAQLTDCDHLFVDEAHTLFTGGKSAGAWLLHLLENGVIVGPLGAEPAPAVTVIMATTEPDRLPLPILQRLTLRPALTRYTNAEATRIARSVATRVMGDHNLPPLDTTTAKAIATAAGNNPRHIRALLITLRDLTLARGTPYDLPAALTLAGMSADGLPTEAQHYLVQLLNAGGRAGERTFKDARLVEDLLIDRGLIARTPQGRTLTDKGLRRALELRGAASPS